MCWRYRDRCRSARARESPSSWTRRETHEIGRFVALEVGLAAGGLGSACSVDAADPVSEVSRGCLEREGPRTGERRRLRFPCLSGKVRRRSASWCRSRSIERMLDRCRSSRSRSREPTRRRCAVRQQRMTREASERTRYRRRESTLDRCRTLEPMGPACSGRSDDGPKTTCCISDPSRGWADRCCHDRASSVS